MDRSPALPPTQPDVIDVDEIWHDIGIQPTQRDELEGWDNTDPQPFQPNQRAQELERRFNAYQESRNTYKRTEESLRGIEFGLAEALREPRDTETRIRSLEKTRDTRLDREQEALADRTAKKAAWKELFYEVHPYKKQRVWVPGRGEDGHWEGY